MDTVQIQEVIQKHAAWLRGDTNGARAILRGAILRSADLSGAILRSADLRSADLRSADLRSADLRSAILRSADLSGAILRGAILRGAILRSAILRSADLSGAILRSADLSGAILEGAKLPPFQIPQEGELIVWKRVKRGLVKLRIPPQAKRTASLVGRKCRAEFAEVLETPDGDTVLAMHDVATAYTPGQTVRPDSYDPDPRVECTHGIHFFLTREEAEDY